MPHNASTARSLEQRAAKARARMRRRLRGLKPRRWHTLDLAAAPKILDLVNDAIECFNSDAEQGEPLLGPGFVFLEPAKKCAFVDTSEATFRIDLTPPPSELVSGTTPDGEYLLYRKIRIGEVSKVSVRHPSLSALRRRRTR